MKTTIHGYAALLVRYLRPQRWKALALTLLLLTSIGLQLLNPQLLRGFIDTALSGGSDGTLLRTALLFLLVGLANQLLGAAATYVGADVGWSATNQLREELALHCLRLDMPFHHERTPGELIERIDGDVTALSNFFSQFVVRVGGSLLLLLGVLLLLFREDWRVGLVMLLYAGLAVLLLNRLRDAAVPATAAEREASAHFFGFLEERLAGLDDLRANGGGGHTMQRFYGVLRTLYHKTHRAWMSRSKIWMLIMAFFALGDVLAIGMGLWLFRAGAITVGTVYLFFQYTEMLRGPLEQITQQLQELQKAAAGIQRVRALMETQRLLQDGAGLPIPDGPLTVEFESVSFAYGAREPILKDIHLRLEAGTVLGLLGRTGSGKSSLVRLLFRLYDPSLGAVRLGGVATRDAAMSQLRRRVGMVTQEVQLFHASVRDNLTFFDPTIPDERIRAVVAELGLEEWLERLPAGLDTELAAGGSGLSAGEAQLLAFTRVFLQEPGLVILDEPSSRLDPATEQRLEAAMARLLAGRTAIIIAHRLGTVERADQILVLDQGRIAEFGARAALAADPDSHFAQLLRTSLGAAA